MESSELQRILSENIKKYRLINNMTQQRLAECADISVGYLCDLESGKKWGTAETITKLANALGVYPFQLYYNQNNSKEVNLLSLLSNLSQDIKSYVDSRIREIIEENNK